MNYVASCGLKLASPGLDHCRQFSVFIHCYTVFYCFLRVTSQSVSPNENEPDLYKGETK